MSKRSEPEQQPWPKLLSELAVLQSTLEAHVKTLPRAELDFNSKRILQDFRVLLSLAGLQYRQARQLEPAISGLPIFAHAYGKTKTIDLQQALDDLNRIQLAGQALNEAIGRKLLRGKAARQIESATEPRE